MVDELGPDYQQQAWQAVQNKYEASHDMQNEAVGQQAQEPEIEAGTGTEQTLEDGAETAETAAETAVPEYGATRETAEAAKTAANETAEASGQSFEAPAGGGSGGEGGVVAMRRKKRVINTGMVCSARRINLK